MKYNTKQKINYFVQAKILNRERRKIHPNIRGIFIKNAREGVDFSVLNTLGQIRRILKNELI